jgi:undecaprenyl-diphosphatase
MPEWLVVVILGIIEGITEFLPISSTGHMLLAQNWLPHQQSEAFFAIIQCGAVLAVLLVFSQRLKEMCSRWADAGTRDFIVKLMTAFILTGIAGLILKKLHFKLEKNPAPIAWATLIGGVVIIGVEWMNRGRQLRDEITWPVTIVMWIGQLLAVIFPGASRSGSTIILAMGIGSSRKAATEFSFLLGIPTLLAAGVLEAHSELKKAHLDPNGIPTHWPMVALGSVVAAVTAFVVVRWLLRYIQTHTFVGFGWYRIVLGVVILLLISRGLSGL